MHEILIENVIKVGMAVLIGGLIGAEREFQDKAAGFRTIIIITVGSALFTIFSLSMDPGFTKTRIAANIVTGIGFLGAGAIVRQHGRIGGLTTAATIWLAAALGMGIGAGELIFVAISTAVVLIVLFIFPYLEKWIDQSRAARSYRMELRSSQTRILRRQIPSPHVGKAPWEISHEAPCARIADETTRDAIQCTKKARSAAGRPRNGLLMDRPRVSGIDSISTSRRPEAWPDPSPSPPRAPR